MRFREYLDKLGGTSFLYANASNGLKDVLAHLVRASGTPRPNVVLPSYLPAKLYRTAMAAGCAVRPYEVYGPCTFDVADVERQVDPDTIAILYVHYFGFPHRLEEIAALAERRGIPMIEDCALTLAASHRGKALGTFGDVAIFSMRKVLLYSEGGFVRVSDRYRDFRPAYEWRVRSLFSASRYLRQRMKYGYVRLTGGADPLGLFRVNPSGYLDLSRPQRLHVKAPSAFTERRLGLADLDAVVRKRRENYAYLAQRLPASPLLEPLHPTLPEGCTPYSFPILVPAGRRDRYRAELLEDGIVAGAGWPESPFDPALARTSELSGRLVELPIHQALTQRQLDRSLKSLDRLAAVHPRLLGAEPRCLADLSGA